MNLYKLKNKTLESINSNSFKLEEEKDDLEYEIRKLEREMEDLKEKVKKFDEIKEKMNE